MPACWWIDLPETDYKQALDLQLAVVSAKTAGRLDADVILCVEHPRIFTLGRRGGRENLCVTDHFLAEKGVSVVPTDRGGNITYHGPGQLVAYPIIDLNRRRLKVVEFVSGLEQAMILTAGHWGIDARTDPANRGVWLNGDKLGSIGITVRRGVSFHGLALNVNTDMEPFTWINPCGLDQVRMTSFERHLNGPVAMAEARQEMAAHLAEVFGIALTTVGLEQLYAEIELGD
ncbi:MAG: lipoyl(octanoyl) transferase LipB [Deltaproteobacteria bacterium]|nr:lipoyl(octanoyl) transferase LipB [Deltaproteobacteria bacterium]